MKNFLEYVRSQAFWLLDTAKGSAVKKNLLEIQHVLEQQESDATEINSIRKVAALLQHATEKTSYYNPYKGKSELCDFPVINKNLIRENEDLFISNDVDKQTLFKVVTSGSTGTPFSVYHDARKRRRNTADTIYFAKITGFEVGHKIYYFKIWNSINKKSFFETWSQNVEACNVFELSDSAILKLLDKINADKSTLGFLGYASAFDAMCRVLDLNKDIKMKANITSIIAMSEALNSYTKDAMQRHFNCKCVSRYSNVENGMIAQQSIHGGNEFYINSASYVVEILNTFNDEPCPAGQDGRVVVTDLYNYAMPMIRYDTGDIGSWNEKLVNNKKRLVLEKVEGRKMDMVYNTEGNLVSSFTITNNMWKFNELKQYQFIQTEKNKYRFILNCDIPFTREKELINEFEGYFGTGAEITVEYVQEIPLLNSGKRKKVLNLMQS